MNKFALILAGGKGTRLWPLSRENHPKQFVEFKDGMSLFQLTIKRTLSTFDASRLFIISQENYKFTLYNQLEQMPGLSEKARQAIKANILFEPCPKNTLPAIILAIKYIEVRTRVFGPDDLLYVFPSDHVIEPVPVFKKCMEEGGKLALTRDKIVVFGVPPTAPKEGYGYIMPDGVFVEKPSTAKAQKLIAEGALWNAGIFCFSRRTFSDELRAYQPSLHKEYCNSLETFLKHFPELKADSIDYGIMQKTRKVGVVKFTARWTDLGSWDSFLQFYCRGKGNFKIGSGEFVDSDNCFSYSKNRLVCMVGLKDVIAVDSSDSLLLVKKGSSDRVKQLVADIDKRKLPHTKDSSTVYRPWGYYTVLHESKGYKVKEIGVYPGKALSLQSHRRRSEHWNVVDGSIKVTIGKMQTTINKNQGVFVPQGQQHRIENKNSKIAKIIEVQIGAYVGEDDIVRYSSYE